MSFPQPAGVLSIRFEGTPDDPLRHRFDQRQFPDQLSVGKGFDRAGFMKTAKEGGGHQQPEAARDEKHRWQVRYEVEAEAAHLDLSR